MDIRRIIASLCYFSIFFAGIVLPLVVYFVSNDRWVKDHAKAAFLSHLLPYAAIIAVPFAWYASGPSIGGILGVVLLFAAAGAVIFVWNIYRGIQTLIGDDIRF
ncbi:DUF4870 domain-containing protein [Paenibacillus thermoaerophilus]|uniref:DUF4870 domain-containing protein n=1 Tax=Paenibacillus thermoaerophilus TaxID=1215385 RepID=A0ABW2V4B2_9BACL|nr:DUF4870 domain-containing protein [Paenibacillus thermoaerophilus]TMV11037.1 DUF4870 domain-containing protein [Paenibacillus thermoaerophilus]